MSNNTFTRTLKRTFGSVSDADCRSRTTPSFITEPLEGRTLMSGTPLPDGISFSAGAVRINGGAGEDVASVTLESGKLKVTLDHVQYVHVDLNTTTKFVVHDPAQYFDPAKVTRVEFYGQDGADTFTNDTSVKSNAFGDAGEDTLSGGAGNDVLVGGDGNDSLEGRGGNDQLTGGAGDDTYLFAGRSLGADIVTEAASVGTDALDFSNLGIVPQRSGPRQPARTSGLILDLSQTSNQNVAPGDLQLKLSSGAGIENVEGTAWGDSVTGNARPNMIDGLGGADTLTGQDGDDWLSGGDGNDSLNGGAGNDHVGGDAGDDVVHGGVGNDILTGGDGRDVVFGDFGADTITGGAGNDRLYASVSDTSHLDGGAGDDTLVSVGGASDDSLHGGAGYDSFWLDTAATETTDADAAEIGANHVHRIGSYFSCKIDYGMGNVANLGAPGLSRNGAALADPLLTQPANQTFKDFRKYNLFSSAGPSPDDIKQGSIGDCYFMSFLAAIAKVNPDHVRQSVVDLGDGTYAVNFKGENNQDVYVRVDGDLAAWKSTGNLCMADFGKEQSIWVPVIEKAWAFYRNEQGTYASATYWHPEYKHSPYVALNTPATETTVASLWNGTNASSGQELLKEMKAALDAGKAVLLSGPHPLDSSTQMVDANKHSFAHAYMVDWVSNDFSQVRIRNPYATQGPNGDGYTTISAERAFYCCYNFTVLNV